MSARLNRLRRMAAAALVAAMFGFAPCGGATAQTGGSAAERMSAGASRADRIVHLPLSKSKILDFDEDIRDIIVSDPKIADAIVRSSRRLYVIGNKFGTTNVVVLGASGRPLANLELQVEVDTQTLESLLKRILPKSSIRVEAVAGSVVLSGSVSSGGEAVQAYEVASRFVGAPAEGSSSGGSSGASTASAGSSAVGSTIQVVNALTIGGKDQVMLKVTIAEVQRTAVKTLGIDLTSTIVSGNWAQTLAASTISGIAASSSSTLAGSGTYTAGASSLKTKISALEQNGLMKTLAEPNLSALSGEQAQFLVGGEYPIPVSQSSSTSGTTIGVEYKTYGIALNFQPVVLSEDRINLTVKTEVSALTTEGEVNIGLLTIPALRVRRASTTLEVPSGGMMVLGGLIQDDVKQAINGTPGLLNIPILGTLFRSREFTSSQSELVIFIQPIVVRPVAAGKLQRPDQNLQPSGDASAILMGRIHRIYRNGAGAPEGNYAGRFGYILD